MARVGISRWFRYYHFCETGHDMRSFRPIRSGERTLFSLLLELDHRTAASRLVRWKDFDTGDINENRQVRSLAR